MTLATQRAELLARLGQSPRYDLAIVGGGATGLGIAVDAAAQGLSVLLLEAQDFAKGTSSRATKLAHGGVRYLAQGNIALVREALHERENMLHNAPHLVSPLAFVLPTYRWWEQPFYGVGLKLYDLLAGRSQMPGTKFLNAAQVQAALPTVQTQGLRGGIQYWDGQFDDARLALALARTAAQSGALLLNYCPVTGLVHENGKIAGLHCTDSETGQSYTVRSGCIINATGVWVDELRHQDGDAIGRSVKSMVAPSQGVHVVVDAHFYPGNQAMLVPKTADGRVLFAVPWRGKVILGTTDTPRHDLALEPEAFEAEIDFILGEAGKYLRQGPTRSDIKSLWVGLRPLVKPPDDDGDNTKGLSREHTILVSRSGMVTVTGGKWTTYRAIAEDVLQRCADKGLLKRLQRGATTHLQVVGSEPGAVPSPLSAAPSAAVYGSDQGLLAQLPGTHTELAWGLTEAMVRFAARYEYARSVEDVLARRSRLLFLDAQLAQSVAPAVAAILTEETGANPRLEAFLALARHYLPKISS